MAEELDAVGWVKGALWDGLAVLGEFIHLHLPQAGKKLGTMLWGDELTRAGLWL